MKDAKKIIESLDAEEIRRRLCELDAEHQALRVFLRAANRRDRERRGLPNRHSQEVPR